MDCEKFDEHVIDALYGELDELTEAALRRHTDGCARCTSILAGLRSAREGAVLPLEEPSHDLEARILDAERAAQKRAPWPRKLMRAAAWAGSHAMRPQLAMAALFMLVVGSSLLLLRARPGTIGAPVEVTERGAPSPAASAAPQGAVAAEAPMRARGSLGKASDQGGLALSDKQEAAPPEVKSKSMAFDESQAAAPGAAAAATAAPNDPLATGGAAPATPQKALAWARDGKSAGGCGEAVNRYVQVAKQFPGSPEAETAHHEAGACQDSVAAAPAPASPAPAKPPAQPAAKPAEKAQATGKAQTDAGP